MLNDINLMRHFFLKIFCYIWRQSHTGLRVYRPYHHGTITPDCFRRNDKKTETNDYFEKCQPLKYSLTLRKDAHAIQMDFNSNCCKI